MSTPESITQPISPTREPIEGRKLLIGGFTYSKKMMEAWAEEVSKLEAVTDVETITLVESLRDPDLLRRMARGALVEGHSGAAASYREAQPTGALEVKMTAAAERQCRPRLIEGAVILNAHQTKNALVGPKDERARNWEVVTGKAHELGRLPDLRTNYRALGLISVTSTVEMLEAIHEADPNVPVTDSIIPGDQFGFVMTRERIKLAEEKGVEVIILEAPEGEPDFDHETPVAFPKKTNHLVNHERVAA